MKGGNTMKFNYSKLLGRIREKGFTQETLAEAIKISKGTLSAKLNNRAYFTTLEMCLICDVLHIAYKDISLYFFAVEVQKK
jgi:transcriptional regulator with XRE-family HTH domain